MAKTEDSRYVRTENAIRAAFIELVAEKPPSAITVSEICRRAGISRNAFYLHYAGAQALFTALVGELVDDLHNTGVVYVREASSDSGVNGDMFDDADCPAMVLKTLARHETLLRALLPTDDGSVAKMLIRSVEKAYRDAGLTLSERADDFDYRLKCAFIAGAQVTILARWIEMTARPITELEGLFVSLQLGTAQASLRYLTGFESTLS